MRYIVCVIPLILSACQPYDRVGYAREQALKQCQQTSGDIDKCVDSTSSKILVQMAEQDYQNPYKPTYNPHVTDTAIQLLKMSEPRTLSGPSLNCTTTTTGPFTNTNCY